MRRALLPLMLSAAVLGASVAHASDSPVPAATLSGIDGTVLVNQGEYFVNARTDTALDAGDRVLLMSGARARLGWADGCVVDLDPEAMVSIAAISPCAGGTAAVTALGPMTAQAVGDTGVSDDDETVAPVADGTTASSVRDSDPDSYTWLIVGGVGVGLVLAASGGGGSSSTPPSPPPPPPPPPVSP